MREGKSEGLMEEHKAEIKKLELELLDAQSNLNRMKHMKKKDTKGAQSLKQLMRSEQKQREKAERENKGWAKRFGNLKEEMVEQDKKLRTMRKLVVLFNKELKDRGMMQSQLDNLTEGLSGVEDIDDELDDLDSLNTEEELDVKYLLLSFNIYIYIFKVFKQDL